MADMKMHTVKRKVPAFMKEMNEKPKADFPRVHIDFDAFPPELQKQVMQFAMNGNVKLMIVGELVGKDIHEGRGSDKVRGSITVEVHKSGAVAGKGIGDKEMADRVGSRT